MTRFGIPQLLKAGDGTLRLANLKSATVLDFYGGANFWTYQIFGDAAGGTNAYGTQVTELTPTGAPPELEVSVGPRFADGGAIVRGSVTNKKLAAGATVSLRFTFYTAAGDPIGTVTESVAVGGEDMAEVFQVQFDSAETVDGYGYELTVG